MQHEVEIKSLLANKDQQDAVVAKMKQLDPEYKLIKRVVHHNHYYKDGDLAKLVAHIGELSDEEADSLNDIKQRATSTSLRTRDISDTQSLLVLKGAIGGDADHAVDRLEFEKVVAMPQAALDQLVQDSGFTVLSKWYAERDQYQYKNVTVEIIFTSGYGFLTEVEYVAHTAEEAKTAEQTVRNLMAELGLTELPGDRLARMFAHYNAHWQEYYGSRKTFTLE